MATPNPLQVTDADLAPGEYADITVTFQTAPATPDVPEIIELTFNGSVYGNTTASVMRRGTPAEPTPTVVVGATTGWGIRTQSGRLLTPVGGKFRLTN